MLAWVSSAPLGTPWCPRELDHGRVRRAERYAWQTGLRGAVDEFGEVVPALVPVQVEVLCRAHAEALDVVGHPGHDDPLEPRLLCQGADVGQHHVEGDERLHARDLHDVSELAGRVQGVQVGDDGTQRQCGQVCDNELGAVGQVDAHPIALPYPERSQGVGHAEHLFPDLPEGHFAAVEVHAGLVRIRACRKLEHGLGRDPRVPDGGGDIVVVVSVPGFLIHHEKPPPVRCIPFLSDPLRVKIRSLAFGRTTAGPSPADRPDGTGWPRRRIAR